MIYKCVRCGKEFQASHKTSVCKDCHTGICIICGKEFKLIHPYTQKTCSRECRGIYVKRSGIAKSRTVKAQQTVKEKYGTSRPPQNFKPKMCELCGKEFIPESNRQVYCNGPHYGNCPVCGKQVEIREISRGPQVCSTECRQKLIAKTCIEKYGHSNYLLSNEGRRKSIETCLKNYGVDHPFKNKEFKEKIDKINIEKYGTKYPMQNKTVLEKAQQTNLEKYGTKYPLSNEIIKAKSINTHQEKYGGMGFGSEKLNDRIKQTMLEKYGVEYSSQSPEIRSIKIQNNLKKYGVSCPTKLQYVQDKIEQTNLKRYGVRRCSQTLEFKNKLKETCLRKYGVTNVFKSDIIKDKIKETNLEKYGVVNAMQNEAVKDKMKSTNLEKYGATNYNSSVYGVAKRINDPSKIDEFMNFKSNPREYIESNYDNKPTSTQLSKDLGVDTTTICVHINNNDCKDLINYHISTIEYEVIEFIKSLKDGITIIHNDRNVISPLEIDVYLPEFRFGIECNPSFTHNASIIDPWGAGPKHYLYHKMKTDKCREVGIELFHIFGWEWEYKRDIIKSMIKNRLGETGNRIYARNTKVVEVDFKTSVNFLNETHLQGMLSAPIRLGLIDQNDELVSLMTFGKMRSTIGQGQGNQYELSRFCNKLNTSVIGGASKLLKHYMKHYNTPLISFSDNAHTTGKLYENLNFKRDHDVAPRYTWVDPFTEYTINRLKTQKHNLRKLFNDDTIDIDNKTEKEIMLEHGYVQVYDAGLTKWVLDN